MKIVLASTFRDATPYLGRYIDQALLLKGALDARGDSLEFVWGEGDSLDDTAEVLSAVDPGAVVDVSTGHRFCPSTEDSEDRWANVAQFCNLTLDAAPACDVLLWVESDLIWTVDTALSLIDRADELGVVAAPMWHADGFFYDIYTTRLDGERFDPPRNAGLVRVDSCAGMLAIRGDLAATARYAPDSCRSYTRDLGGAWLDTNLEVVHP